MTSSAKPSLKKTALSTTHVESGGKIVDFGGWELPVQYSSVTAEHQAVRTAAGLFDVSHMGEIWVIGPMAQEFTQFVTTNDCSRIGDGQAQYTALCNERGGIVDDLVIYKFSDQKFLYVVNASNTEKDFAHLLRVREIFSGRDDVQLENASAQFSQLALQGPKSAEILQSLTSERLERLPSYGFCQGAVAGIGDVIVARTGYTGEDGFELYCPWGDGPKLWAALMNAGKNLGLLPCGLGARDTLRLEMKYALYGHELTEDTHPLEVGLGWITKLGKPNFVGKSALETAKAVGVKRALVGVQSLGRAIPRQGYDVVNAAGLRVGTITSGTQSPSLKLPIGVALVERAYETVGTRLWVRVREELHEFEVVKTPFYKRN